MKQSPDSSHSQHIIAFLDKEAAAQNPCGHWIDTRESGFFKDQVDTTTILHGGLTNIHDKFFGAGLRYFGFKTQALRCPDKSAMETGKEYGNRGQCNPTYFTVGNLINHLQYLRDVEKIPTSDIINNYLYLTAGSCGPCRFGMYITEYRKALRDAGFEGFRVISIQQVPDKNPSGRDNALQINPNFFRRMLSYFIAADVINLMGYRIRPYETIPGSTNMVLEQCTELVVNTITHNKNITKALKQCRNLLRSIDTNKLQARPKVSIIGEFWAMTTEGDGNYKLQQFLEKEGAECDMQPLTNWMLYVLWTLQHDAKKQFALERSNTSYTLEAKKHPLLKASVSWLGSRFIQYTFQRYARAIGLHNYALSNMDEIAELAKDHYHTDLRGGEGHMEVGKLISTFKHNKAHLVISVKPFGCMPSSGVSDGVQSLVCKKYPGVNFLPVETTGDGAVNVYSRIQMALFKSRTIAEQELQSALQSKKMNNESAQKKLNENKSLGTAISHPGHKVACTAANVVYAL